MTLEVIGAGFGRTGTLSLKLALERLGLGPCYHMVEAFEHPDHIPLWEEAADDPAFDWERIMAGYRSAVDWPTCHFWRGLAAAYPAAKVVLTTRDPEAWYKSAWSTIFQLVARPTPPELPQVFHDQARMSKKIIVERDMDGRVDDREQAIACYLRHVEEVKRTIPQGRLLVWSVADGWVPLCGFLGVPVPAEEFPRANRGEDFPAKLQEIMAAHAVRA
jgi:hypothetical protein